LTILIDGGTPATYARMRQGANLDQALANARRIQRWKEKLGSELPHLDSFFVVMRSNFREIPWYLELMREHGFTEVALQTAEINDKTLARASLVRDEVIAEPEEIRELYALMLDLGAARAAAVSHDPDQRSHLLIRIAGFGLFPSSRSGRGAVSE
jgi:hypothetical protein